MTKTETIKTLAQALVAAQRNIGAAAKDGKNPHFKSDYATLESVILAVKGPLNDAGIAFIQAVGMADDGRPYVETTLMHESGESISTKTPVYCAKPDNPQALGSGITYSKRYALQAMLGLPTTDDDGNSAMPRGEQQSQASTLPPVPDGYFSKAEVVAWIQGQRTVADSVNALALRHTLTDADRKTIEAIFASEVAA